LIAGFESHTHQTSAAQSFESLLHPNLEVLLAGVQGEEHGNLLTAFQRFAGGFVGSNDQELDLPQIELFVQIVRIEAIDLAGDLEDGLRDERRDVGAGFDGPTELTVWRLGGKALLAKLLLEGSVANHGYPS
jgi:hypothetical protein